MHLCAYTKSIIMMRTYMHVCAYTKFIIIKLEVDFDWWFLAGEIVTMYIKMHVSQLYSPPPPPV